MMINRMTIDNGVCSRNSGPSTGWTHDWIFEPFQQWMLTSSIIQQIAPKIGCNTYKYQRHSLFCYPLIKSTVFLKLYLVLWPQFATNCEEAKPIKIFIVVSSLQSCLSSYRKTFLYLLLVSHEYYHKTCSHPKMSNIIEAISMMVLNLWHADSPFQGPSRISVYDSGFFLQPFLKTEHIRMKNVQPKNHE